MLAHRLPYPPTTGDRVRAYHVARRLAARHQLTLACPLTGHEELAAVRMLQRQIPDIEYAAVPGPRRWARALAGLATGVPISVGYFRSRALAVRIRARLDAASYDAVYISSSSMAQYAPAGVSALVDFVDVDSAKFARYAASKKGLSWLYRLEAHRLRGYERAAARRAVFSVFVTDAEATSFRAIAPDAITAVVPNGVDHAYFHGGAAVKSSLPTVIFTGALDYLPNVDAVRYFGEAILPVVRREVPGVRFVVVGRRPGRAIRRLVRRAGITVVADVPDVRPYLAAAHVAVAPLRIACGVPNKILEAMAMGLPVVATRATTPAIAAEIGTEWFVEDGAEAFGARVVKLLGDADHRARVGVEARRFVESRCSWTSALGGLDALIEATPGSSIVSDPCPTHPSGAPRRHAHR